MSTICSPSEIFSLIIKEGARAMTHLAELFITTALVSREFHVHSHGTLQVYQAGPAPVGVSNSDRSVLGTHQRRCRIRAGWLSLIHLIAQYLSRWTTNPSSVKPWTMVLWPRSCVNCSNKARLLAREGRFNCPFSYSITRDGPGTSLIYFERRFLVRVLFRLPKPIADNLIS
jgi:hypothetical protein